MTQKIRTLVERDLDVPFGPDVYTKHNEMVQRVIPKDQLLVYHVDEGWGPLCKFLTVEVPEEPFPSVNELDSMKKIYFGMQAFGAFVWSLYFGAAAGASYLAMHPQILTGGMQKISALFA